MKNPIITSLLDTDVYKYRMHEWIKHYYPDRQAVFELINRKPDISLVKHMHVDELQEELDNLKTLTYTLMELEYLKKLNLKPSFSFEHVRLKAYMDKGDIAVLITGNWSDATMAETFVMSIINELVSRNVSLTAARAKLLHKYAVLMAIPEINVVDFGTRRRHSMAWHEKIVQDGRSILKGTSNMRLAMLYDMPCFGTMAHEIFMGVAALYDKSPISLRASQQIVLQQWFEYFKGQHTVAPTDTWGTSTFFRDWTEDQAHAWQGYRQDSGNPDEFMSILIAWFARNGSSLSDKEVTFSDALVLASIIGLFTKYGDTKFGPRINFGWGTALTNDTGADVPHIVVKLTSLDNRSTVKLGDGQGKEQGMELKRSHYRDVFLYDRYNK